MIRVAIIDDHVIVRTGLKYLVEADPELELAGEFGGGVGAVDFYRAVKPDVTLLDVRMPDRGGIDVLHDLLEADPDARVVMLTTSGTDEDIYRSLELGAKGYVLKDGDSGEIMKAIRTVADGGKFIPEDVRVIYDRRAAAPEITGKELETLRLVAEGHTNREIAETLAVSEVTVKVRLTGIFTKLGARDRVDAVNRAVERGLIPPRA